MQTKGNIIFRVDADNTIGTGHLSRCLIMAKALKKEKYKITFLTNKLGLKLKNKINQEHFLQIYISGKKNESEEILSVARSIGKPILIITDGDNESFYNESFQKNIISAGLFLMTITMFNYAHFYSHIVFNQNPLALYQDYKTAAYTKKLFGPDYIILSDRFCQISRIKNFNQSKKIFFLSFGGADSKNITNKVLDSLFEYRRDIDKIIVVAGALNKQIRQIEQKIQKLEVDTKIELYINTEKIADLMNESSLAITSAGLTMWELSYLNIQNWVVSSSLREQVTAQWLAENNHINYLGHYNHKDLISNINQSLFSYFDYGEYNNKKLSKKGLVDGRGIERLVSEINNLFNL